MPTPLKTVDRRATETPVLRDKLPDRPRLAL